MMYRRMPALSVVAAALVLVGCASVQSQWKKATATNTIDGYRTFAAKHAAGVYADSAQLAIERLKLEAADKERTIAVYQAFIAENPGSPLVAMAEDRIDELQFNAATATNTIAAYKDFITQNPNGPRAAAARQNTDKLKTEMIAQEPAVAQEVLVRHPASARKGAIPPRYVGSWVNPDMWDGVAHDYLLITSSYIIWKALAGPDRGEHVFKPGSYEVGAKGLKFTAKMVAATTAAGDTFRMSVPLTFAVQPAGLKGKSGKGEVTVKGRLADLRLNGVEGTQVGDKVRLVWQPDTFLLVKAGTRP